MKKVKESPNDGGLSPKEVARLRSAIRMVWQRCSHARKLCQKRCLTEDGFSKCESCDNVVPKIQVDHKIPAGSFDAGYIKRMFCASSELQALCQVCHTYKTKEERKRAKNNLPKT